MAYWVEILAAAVAVPLLAYVARLAARFVGSARLTLRLPHPLPDALVGEGRIGLLYVRDCTAGDGLGPVRNRVVWFKRGTTEGSWAANVRYPKRSGFVFKCFIERSPLAFDEAAHTLVSLGYREASKGSHNRIWFLFPDPYSTAAEPGGFTNNLLLPV